MKNLRFEALSKLQNKKVIPVKVPASKISEYFGQDAFGMKEMEETLSPDTFKKLKRAIEKGEKIDEDTANAIAQAVKSWAMSKGITHYAHWFQPLTGNTAEKHDTFFDIHSGIEKFKGSSLVQQEPDGSSFPSGGIRSTFEARGYTAWDPSSPMFRIGHTLCIPSIFVSYTGESLDYKTPLLKSIEVIDKAATAVCRFFDKDVSFVKPMLGIEQEYFVVDKGLANARPDLVMCGKTVFGHIPARGQQLEDHYFGSIPSRIFAFMQDFEIEALKLGIPVSTRHNEVAPGQFEVVQQYEELNIAIDHNQLLRNVMRRVADKHDLEVLFHEKPFNNLNGSGKHCNWSLQTSAGVNVFQPTSSARENLLFLTFLVTTVKAVWEYAPLLRASVASAGNEDRLGGFEAPPTIVSVFLGAQLNAVLDELETNGNVTLEKGDNMYMKLGIDKIPEIILDNTDRNRTSPFAFTGNKFEFRMTGADANVAFSMTVLNLMVADQLFILSEKVEKQIEKGVEKRLAIVNVLREFIKASKLIRFDGDSYSEEWIKEAKKRGLPNITNTPEALDEYIAEKNVKLFKRYKVCSERELTARYEILLENYIKKLQIEARIMEDLALNHILPVAIEYQNELLQNASSLKALGLENKSTLQMINEISHYIAELKQNVTAMNEERKKVNKTADLRQKAEEYYRNIKIKYFSAIRRAADKLEIFVSNERWTLPKYRELLFLR
ncbi:MAG: glutamine synthetase III [Cytophagales bacterium]|nr:glutamine synthetase III [Cytophagales bacterium]MDW8384804.1 glutamine synthetase III [Flammeovirgaceae bacterium]